MDRNSFQYNNFNNAVLPNFGFKIHISATIDNYLTIKRLLLPFLESKKLPYKFLKNSRDVYENFSFKETLAESGKYFTIYPS